MAGVLTAGPTIAAVGPQATYDLAGLAALAAAALSATVIGVAKQGLVPSPPR